MDTRIKNPGHPEVDVKVKWTGDNKDERFCHACGRDLATAEKSGGFDTASGQPVVIKWKYCPHFVVKSFLWWEWNEYPCYSGTPDEPQVIEW